jgi:hypothetical protein
MVLTAGQREGSESGSSGREDGGQQEGCICLWGADVHTTSQDGGGIMSRRCSSKNFDRTVRMRACERRKQAKAAPLSNTYLNYSSTVVFEGPQG